MRRNNGPGTDVVSLQQAEHLLCQGMTFTQMDCRQMDLPDASVQCVLDKGTLDSILCGEASTLNVQKCLSEVCRVLTGKGGFFQLLLVSSLHITTWFPPFTEPLVFPLRQQQKTCVGVYISISHGQPAYRLTYLQRPEFGWDVRVHTVAKPMMGMSGSALASEEKDNVFNTYLTYLPYMVNVFFSDLF